MADPTIEVFAGIPMDASEACTQTMGMLATKEGGKTYLGSRFFEEFHRVGAPFIAFDPVGKWSALTLAADGEGPGLSIPVIGGFRGDVPLDEELAEPVARYLIDNGLSAVVDVSQLRSKARSLYAAKFFEEAFETSKRVQRPHMVGTDEVQLIAPQVLTKEARLAYEALLSVVRLGRNYGLGSMMLSQRPESVNKEVLNLIECLFVGRLTGPQERKTIKGWVTHNKANVQAQLEELPSLGKGEFFLWSPSWLDRFEKVKATAKWTFDSSSTPRLNSKVKPTTKSRRDVADYVSGLQKLASKPVSVAVPSMKIAAEQIVSKLERDGEAWTALSEQLAEANQENVELRQRHTQVVLDNEGLLSRIRKAEVALVNLRDTFRRAHGELEQVLERLTGGLDAQVATLEARLPEAAREWPGARADGRKKSKSLANGVVAVDVDRVLPKKESRGARTVTRDQLQGPSGGLGRCERSLLGALVQHGDLALQQAALMAGYPGVTPIVKRSIGQLRTRGLVAGTNGLIVVTELGVKHPAMKNMEKLPTGEELARHWLERLGKCERRILSKVIARFPKRVPLDVALAGSEYSVSDPIVKRSAGRLRTLKLVDGDNSGMLANERLVG